MDEDTSSSENTEPCNDKSRSSKSSNLLHSKVSRPSKMSTQSQCKTGHKVQDSSVPSSSQAASPASGASRAKRDREGQDEDDNHSMSADSSSDESMESTKKIRKETAKKNSKVTSAGKSNKVTGTGKCSKLAASGKSNKVAGAGKRSKVSATGHSSKEESAGNSSKGMPSTIDSKEKAHRKSSKDRGAGESSGDTGAAKDSEETASKKSSKGKDRSRQKKKSSNSVAKGRDSSMNSSTSEKRREKSFEARKVSDDDMSSDKNDETLQSMEVTEDDSINISCSNNKSIKPQTVNGNTNNNCESQAGSSREISPRRRRRSRSYRSRLDESPDDDEAMETNTAATSDGGDARRRTRSRTRRSNEDSRANAGELRETSRHRRAAQDDSGSVSESRPFRVAQFVVTDSDDSEPQSRRESRSRRSTRRSSSSSRPAVVAAGGDNNDNAVGHEDANPEEDDPSTAADASVAASVTRRTGLREARRSGRRSSDAAAPADDEVHVRRYPRHRMLLTDSSSSSSSSPLLDVPSADSDSADSTESPYRSRARRRRRATPGQQEAEIQAEVKALLDKPLPKHKFHLTKEMINRQYGGGVCRVRARDGCGVKCSLDFSNRYYSSLHTVQRLELMSKLNYHQGCVNSVGFSSSGSILVSGSDDLQIALWDWNREKMLMAFPSGHRNNVFQTKFLPLLNDRNIVTCARDGQVRLAEIAESVCRSTRRLAKHNGPCHKLAVSNGRPQVVLSAGGDGEVKEADLRVEGSNTIAITTDDFGTRVALHSIHAHPLNENQFCVAGRDEYICVYDRRITTPTAPPVLKYCPDNLKSSRPRANATSAVYSNNGDAIVASYSDDDIYLFDTSEPCQAPPAHRYTGHRNSATVKGVNVFGPHSEFVVSGSDCGNVFIWSRETEAVVRCFPADENGVVNVLEWHPHIPLLATSGLDNDVKIWIPSCEKVPKDEKLAETVETNFRERRNSSSDVIDFSDRRMIMMVWQHMRRMQRNRGGDDAGNRRRDDEDADLPLDDSSDDDAFGGAGVRHLPCTPQ